MTDFVGFQKIARLRRNVVVTEKIDGTNAQIHIDADGVRAGSRNRWVTPENDNYGFAAWVKQNEDQIYAELGAGTHFGEWWGQGIQRKYGLAERRFSLFNTTRWAGIQTLRCCHVVPVLASGVLSDLLVERALDGLRELGSAAAPGFMRPEGIVVYHEASNHLYKVTLDGDAVPKSMVVAA